MSERLSFYELVKDYDYTIEIPIIQRDYAQGRVSAEEVRKQFLQALYDYLSGDSSKDLDFVYGSLSENESHNTFTVLDGQQRLTTLFLLHWYLAAKEDRLLDFRKVISYKGKSKFSYETRVTSRDFCNALISNDIVMPVTAAERVSDAIKDSSWFFISWENDPTIKSMLVVLDDIHSLFFEKEGCFDKLINDENPLICFQFIELKNFGLTDSLYVKMNSRGKELTDFENFKAKFEQLLEKHDKANKTNLQIDFSRKIDTEWTDLFWNYRDNKTNLFDEQLMNFIRVISTNYYALKTTEKYYLEYNIKLLIDRSKKITFPSYIILNCFDDKGIKDIINTLDYLKNSSNKIKIYLADTTLIDEDYLFERVVQNQLTYVERIQFYALYKYLAHNKGDNANINSWIRVIRNLSENTIYNDASEYARSIKSVNQLLPQSDHVLQFLNNPANKIDGFAEIQILEEQVKAHLILKDSKWQTAIIKAENHGYFIGQIDFLLKFSGIKNYYQVNNNLNWSDELDNTFYESFTSYFEKVACMFNSTGLNKFDNYLWQRALLTKGDYLLSSSKNDSFLIDAIGERDISWKRLLRDDKNKRDYIKLLLDDISVNTVKADLERIISQSQVSDWRKYFIERPQIFDVCGDKKFIRWENENNILLLERSQTNGWHREYYSFALYLRIKSMGNTIYYAGSNSVDYLKYINSINEILVQISYVYANATWCYRYKQIDDTYLYFGTEDEVVTFLNLNHYIF